MTTNNPTEHRRITVQHVLDRASTQEDRNEMGQFATPPELALQILRYAIERTGEKTKIRFLDPGLGTGAFYSALLSTAPPDRIECGHGYEIDQQLASAAEELWSNKRLRVHHQDFTTAFPPDPEERFNLVICNPPYIRHHHISAEKKRELKERLASQGNMELTGLAGMYAHFIGLTDPWMAEGALAGWLIPSEFMYVNYGEGVRNYLTTKVTLLHIHRFNPEETQFEDALVSSAVVWFVNNPPPPRHTVRMTFGGTLEQPMLDGRVPLETLMTERKWSRYPATVLGPEENEVTLAELFEIKRGIATGNNGFFVLPEEEVERRGIPQWALKPVLPGARSLRTDVVEADADGLPVLDERLFLLDCSEPTETVVGISEELAQYLQEGWNSGIPQTYICSHRSPWYSQEKRPPAPFLCTYMGRTRRGTQVPFRFILNNSQATALNVYLMMYPKEPLAIQLEENAELKIATWEALQRTNPEGMTRQGRVYGGGLHKIEPKELGRVGAQHVVELYNQ